MKICILGAGFTGTLSALVLARSGCDVTVIEKRGDPRVYSQTIRRHAHAFRKTDIDLVSRYLTPYGLRLPADHCGPALYDDRLYPGQIGMGRPTLDRVLADAAERQRALQMFYDSTVSSIRRTNGQRSFLVEAGPATADFDVVLDATGAARTSGKLAERSQSAVTTDAVRERFVYCSWEGGRLGLPDGAVGATVRLGEHTRLQILPLEEDRMVVTTVGAPGEITDYADAVGQLGPINPSLAQILERWSPSPPSYYKASRLDRVRLEKAEVIAIPIGEALIQTPPRFGDGFRHSCAQAGLLQKCLQYGENTQESFRLSLAKYADYVWAGTAKAIQPA